jgi:hypothetical protein
MKKIAFTICAKNYIGLALALEKSIKTYNKDVEFLIFVADEFLAESEIQDLPSNVLVAKDVLGFDETKWIQMSFKYDITEFCTSIKPSCFKYIFKQFSPEACVYFDPDILVFNTLDSIFSQLTTHSILVTPHITTIETTYTGQLNERNLLYSGMFNLGFLALKNDLIALKMLDWWEVRLEDRCFQNMMENYFTDQKWIDFLPSFFPNELLVSDDLGLNLAPWNLFEREIIFEQNTFQVKNRIKEENNKYYPLTFVHFSGYDYKALLKGSVVQGNIKTLAVYDDAKQIFDIYAEFIAQSDFSKYVQLNYSYNLFSNGVAIASLYRKLFRRLLEDGKVNFNPFMASGKFYISLKENGLISESIVANDKKNLNNLPNSETTTIKINRILKLVFKLLGVQKFFMLVRLMRLYSKPENHVYLIDKSYFKDFKIRT